MSEPLSTISLNYSNITTSLVDNVLDMSGVELSTLSLNYSNITTSLVDNVLDSSGVDLSTIPLNYSTISTPIMDELLYMSRVDLSTISLNYSTISTPRMNDSMDISGASIISSFNSNLSTGIVSSPFVISLSELTSSIQVQLQKENIDKQMLDNFVNINPTTIRPSMFEWAAKGFPDYHPVHTVTISLPTQASDGKKYDTLGYLNFLLKSTITDCAAIAQSKMEEIDLSYQYNSEGITWVVRKDEFRIESPA